MIIYLLLFSAFQLAAGPGSWVKSDRESLAPLVEQLIGARPTPKSLFEGYILGSGEDEGYRSFGLDYWTQPYLFYDSYCQRVYLSHSGIIEDGELRDVSSSTSYEVAPKQPDCSTTLTWVGADLRSKRVLLAFDLFDHARIWIEKSQKKDACTTDLFRAIKDCGPFLNIFKTLTIQNIISLYYDHDSKTHVILLYVDLSTPSLRDGTLQIYYDALNSGPIITGAEIDSYVASTDEGTQ